MRSTYVGRGAAQPIYQYGRRSFLMRRKENENEDNINEKGFHSVLAWVDRPPRWHCQLVYGILGMRDDSKYGKILRRTVGSCFAFLMLLLAIAAGWDFVVLLAIGWR